MDIQLICDDPMCHGGIHQNVPTVEIIRDSAADRLPDEDRRLADIIRLVKEAPACGSPDFCRGVIQCFNLGIKNPERATPSPWDGALTANDSRDRRTLASP